jgi:hypothetical protein
VDEGTLSAVVDTARTDIPVLDIPVMDIPIPSPVQAPGPSILPLISSLYDQFKLNDADSNFVACSAPQTNYPSFQHLLDHCLVCGGERCGVDTASIVPGRREPKRCATCGHTGCRGRGPRIACGLVESPHLWIPVRRRKRRR